MTDLPKPDLAPDDDADPPGGPWKSWPAIYVTLAVWGVVCFLVLLWMTGALNVGGNVGSGS